MLQAIIEWLGYTKSEENTKFKRLAVHKIEKAYLNYKSNQRVQKNFEQGNLQKCNIETFQKCDHNEKSI